jgi:predicted membrane-bound spermidine synthase
MAVSVALLGWGFGGIVLHFLKRRNKVVSFQSALIFLVAFAVSMPIYLLTVSKLAISASNSMFYFAISFIPFFLAGVPLAFLYSRLAGSATKLYLLDLAGASLACLLIEPVLTTLGAEGTLLFLGVIGAVSCLSLSFLINKRKALAVSLVVLTASSVFLSVGMQSDFFFIRYGDKRLYGLFYSSEANRTFTEWNSFSRVDTVEWRDRQDIYIDGDASTQILDWDGKIESIQYLKNDLPYLPYYLVQNPRTLIIGPGGGVDVLTALVANSTKITAVELNPLVIKAVDQYKNETSDLYHNPKVDLYIDEGRSFIRRSTDTYDVIDLTLVDSWAAVAAGGYALSENYLYTQQAFTDYMNHLTDRGSLEIIRWRSEAPRLIATLTQSFNSQGISTQDVGNHVAIILQMQGPDWDNWQTRALVIVKKEPFTQAESELIINQTATLGSTFQALYVPYVKDDVEPYSGLFNGSITLQQFSDEFSFKATPVTDDSPFFFNTNKGVPSTLNTLMIISISLAAFSIAVPSLFTLKTQVNRKIGLQHNTPRLPLWLFVLFFSALGVGYMLIEIASVQKFLLFLGNPTRALSVILFSLLLSSGIGSIVSGRLATKSKSVFKGILLACTCVILFTVLYSAILPQIFSALLAADSSIRILTTVLLIFPLGFFMGIPFPSAMRILNVTSNESIPWVWGINGAMSVLGSVLATVSGILFGFSNAILFGAATYLVAFLCAAVWLRMKAQQTQIQEPELMDNLSLK